MRRPNIEKMTREKDVYALNQVLRDNDASLKVRGQAGKALGKIGGEVAVHALFDALKQNNVPVVEIAMSSLRETDLDATFAIPYLIEAMGDWRQWVRSFAAATTGKLGPAAKTAVPVLTTALKDNDLFVQKAAVEALGKIGDATAVPDLVEAVLTGLTQVSWAAKQALGELGYTLAIPHLRKALQDDETNTRMKAVQLLEEIGDAATIPLLREVALEDWAPRVRSCAIKALNSFGTREAQNTIRETVPYWIEKLKDPHFNRGHAASILGEIGDERAIGPLQELLRDEVEYVRTQAMNALKKIQGK